MIAFNFNNRTDVFHVICKLCGSDNKFFLDQRDFDAWQNGDRYIQDALHYLTAAERELLISGTCDICWKKMYPNDDE